MKRLLTFTYILIFAFVSVGAISKYKHVTPAASGDSTGRNWSNTMGEPEFEALMEGTWAKDTVKAGYVIFIKKGTYTLDGAYDWSAKDGTGASPIALIGIHDTTTADSGDVPYSAWAADTNRPKFDCATYNVIPSDLNIIRNIWWQGEANNMVYLNTTYGTYFENCKFENDVSTVQNRTIVNISGPGCALVNCEVTGPNNNGYGIVASGNFARVYYCYIHDLNSAGYGLSLGSAYAIVYGSIFDNVGIAINLATFYMDAMQNTIYDATTGILFGQYYNIVMNNIIDSTSTYGMRTATKNDHLFFWGNHGNNARCTAMWSNIDTTTVFKDYKVTTGDPKFVDETNGDFRLEADSPCYGTAEDIKLGVGE